MGATSPFSSTVISKYCFLSLVSLPHFLISFWLVLLVEHPSIFPFIIESERERETAANTDHLPP